MSWKNTNPSANVVPATYCPLCSHGLLGLEKRLIGTRDELARIIGRKERLSVRVGAGGDSGRSVDRRILAVVDEDNTAIREQRRRPHFGERAVEVSRPIVQQHDGFAGRILDRCPVDQVRRSCQPHLHLSPVHPVLPLNFGGDEAAIREPGDDAGRFVVEMLVFFAHKRGTMLGPVNQISRCGNSDIGIAPVPLGVGKNVSTIFALDYARIFDAARPFPILL